MTAANIFLEGRMLFGATVHEGLRTCVSDASWRNALNIYKKEKYFFCRENKNTHFTTIRLFPQTVTVLKIIKSKINGKGKGLPQQAEVAHGVPGRLRPRIFLTFGTTRVIGCQPYAPAAFTPGDIPGTHFF